MNIKDNLREYINAGYPILYINAYEEIKADFLVEKYNEGKKLVEWNGADGLVDFKTKTSLLGNYMRLDEALSYLKNTDSLDNHIIVLKDTCVYFNDEYPTVISLLKSICHKINKCDIDATIIIISNTVKVPKELEKFITIFEMDEMSQEDIEEYIKKYLDYFGLKVKEKSLRELATAFKGLTEYEIDSLLNLIRAKGSDFNNPESIKSVHEQKRQIIMKTNILEMIDVKEKISDIGGLDNLKHWLDRKASIFKDIDRAMEFGVDMPKGVLIAGIPGCGKSLAAKATAALFEVPLLKLDMGKIMGKYLGESETNMRKAIKLAEAISPCVLWVDELEKGFAGVDGSGHEVTMRLFGTFLTWLQEKKTSVFVVATANDISKMPPELLRKGRFDDIFYVDLPNETERESIFRIHIARRRKSDENKIDYNQLVKKTAGFSGADIEGVVVDAIENAFADGRHALSTDILIKAIDDTKSLSVIMQDKLKELQKFYREKSTFKSAT